MSDFHATAGVVTIALFFLGLMFTWLKWDVKELKRSLDSHIEFHLYKKKNGRGK